MLGSRKDANGARRTTRSMAPRAPENPVRQNPTERRNVHFREPTEEIPETQETQESGVSQTPTLDTQRTEVTPEPVAVTPNRPSRRTTVEEVPDEEERRPPVLPYRNVPAVGTKPKEVPVTKEKSKGNENKHVPAYKRQAPIEKNFDPKKTLDKVLDAKFEFSMRDILGGSKDIQKELKEELKLRNIPLKEKTQLMLAEEEGEYLPFSELSEDQIDEEVVPTSTEEQSEDVLYVDELPPARKTITQLHQRVTGVPKGSIIITDPVLQYYQENGPQSVVPVLIARESAPLRAVFPMINGVKEEESIIDGGSMIVSMARDVAKSLGISWSPDYKIQMQSANKSLETTEGIAKNVPFRFADLTVYLQVHIMKNPAYKVLLGRPFDLLTESVISTSKDGSQVITLTDPVTGARSTIPTFERGAYPKVAQREKPEVNSQDFH